MKGEKVIRVNYWKKLQKEINETINNLHGIILLTHNSVEFSDIVDFLNKIRTNKRLTILYISLINSYSHIKQTLEKYPLTSKKLFVIDCVSGFLSDIEDTTNCFYRKPPDNLEQLENLILKTIGKINPNIIVVDSLSQFINFTNPTDDELTKFYKFLQDLKENVWGLSEDSIILLYDDKMGPMEKLPVMSIDSILRFEVIRQKPKWLG